MLSNAYIPQLISNRLSKLNINIKRYSNKTTRICKLFKNVEPGHQSLVYYQLDLETRESSIYREGFFAKRYLWLRSYLLKIFATKMPEILKHIGDLVGSSKMSASKDTANEWTQ